MALKNFICLQTKQNAFELNGKTAIPKRRQQKAIAMLQ